MFPQKRQTYSQSGRTDRFGNPTMLKTAYAVTNKRTGEEMPIYKTYLEVGGKLLKVEISNRIKETKNGKAAMWVKFTGTTKRQNSGGF